MHKINKLLLTALILANSAHAGTISTGTTVAANPNHSVTFERTGSLGSSEVLSNQFASQGVTFVANSGTAPTLFNTQGCNPGGLTGNGYIAIGVTPGCGVGYDKTIASMAFGSSVAELSFTYTTNNTSKFLFEALRGGTVVSSQAVSNVGAFNNTTFLFKGTDFDTVRFTETGAGTDWFWVDNLSWRSATTSVPEPASLALLGLGLAGMAACRRKRKQA